MKTVDVPGAFLNAELPDLVHMTLVGPMADILIEIAPSVYKPFASKNKKDETVLVVVLTKALYGCILSSLRWWIQLSNVLKDMDFVPNPYDPCVVNKVINGTQCTIAWHVDDLKISHKDEKVVDQVISSLESVYGPLAVDTGLFHTYLGIDFDYSVSGEVSVSMINYFKDIVSDFPDELKQVNTPAGVHLFDVNENPTLLDKTKADLFHQIVAKFLWGSLRCRPDLMLALSFLTSRVQYPDTDD